ncbi:hypothetical protein [Peptostreptococcus equinus]|uniref:Uncharacterized protein n=1 Tax=Peptostreptococcus equinus TaxID=3003601 RepID=A0ABY7JSL5_9FIRM|nr:hypothetical protein [Peptostreptococcus sp. CBA3647]WAW15466.1 hypothetical protein O0R46_03200 [Peptostreptococcus sp. CBA3647]
MIKICRDIFNKIKLILKGENEMGEFLAARITMAFVDEGETGARDKYKLYFSKAGMLKWKTATDESIRTKYTDVLFVIQDKVE